MANADKVYLQDFARKVFRELKAQRISTPFNIAPRPSFSEVNTGGWSARLGNFRGYACSMEIWFDTFTSHTSRKLYYVLYSSKPEGIKKVVKLCKAELGSHIPISRNDWAEDNNSIHLKKRLTVKDFGKPIFEQYPKISYFYGIYEYEKYGLQRNETKRLVERVVDFVITINNVLVANKIKENAEIYKAIENRQLVKEHLQRERNGYVATLAKHRDNFICQICGFDYRAIYGSLGDEFAEAHHKVPLGKNKKERTTTKDDLITVCANCHRMLHRMNGTANDIPQLRKIVKKAR